MVLSRQGPGRFGAGAFFVVLGSRAPSCSGAPMVAKGGALNPLQHRESQFVAWVARRSLHSRVELDRGLRRLQRPAVPDPHGRAGARREGQGPILFPAIARRSYVLTIGKEGLAGKQPAALAALIEQAVAKARGAVADAGRAAQGRRDPSRRSAGSRRRHESKRRLETDQCGVQSISPAPGGAGREGAATLGIFGAALYRDDRAQRRDDRAHDLGAEFFQTFCHDRQFCGIFLFCFTKQVDDVSERHHPLASRSRTLAERRRRCFGLNRNGSKCWSGCLKR